MTPLSQIEALLKEWRQQLDAYEGGSNKLSCDEAGQLSQCADDLDALLASLREAGAEPVKARTPPRMASREPPEAPSTAQHP